MKRYSLQMVAGQPVEFDHPGRVFTLLGCITPVDVSLQAASLRTEIAEGVLPGFYADYEAERFSRIRIVSPVDQPVSFMVSNVKTGYLKLPASELQLNTDLSTAAINAIVNTTVVDLGEDWAGVVMSVLADYLVPSAGGSLAIYCADNPSRINAALCGGQGWNGNAYIATSGSNHQVSSCRPNARYVWGRFFNGGTAQAAGARMLFNIMRNVSA